MKQYKLFFFFLMVLIIPSLCQASITILTNTNPDHTITSGSNGQVYGTAAANNITIESNAHAELINFPGQNSIQILSSSDLFTVSRSGTIVILEGADGTILRLPATTTVQEIVFTDFSYQLVIEAGAVYLGEQVVTLTPALLGGAPSSICDGSHLNLCTAEGSCLTAGGYWFHNDTCVPQDLIPTLSVAFVGCKVADVPGLALVNSVWEEKEWTQERLTAWVDDPDVGFKSYLDIEIFRESGISNQVWVDNWKDIGPTSRYGSNPMESGIITSDCLDAHQISTGDFDIVVMLFNIELGASYGGGGLVWMSKWSSPSTILHEVLHAMSIPRLGLPGLLHSNMADLSLSPVSLEFANTYSIMYGNGQYQGNEDMNPEFGFSPAPLTTANRWMANVLETTSVCEVPSGNSSFALKAWGESGAECLLLKIPQQDGKIITIELQPNSSSFLEKKLDFLSNISHGSRYLIGVKYPQPVDPNVTDWAAIFDPSKHIMGWVYEDILFKTGETANIGNAILTFGANQVQINVQQ